MRNRACLLNPKQSVGLVTYAILSGGPVPSGLMLEGAAHLAGTLYNAGYAPTVFDFNNFETINYIARNGKEDFIDRCVADLHADVQRAKMKLIGFTLYTNGFYDCIQIAKRLKRRNPDLLIAAGGPLVGWIEEAIYHITDAFDLLVRGEGDISIVKIADMVYRNGTISDIPGAIYKSGNETVKNPKYVLDISRLPLPLYDEVVYPAFSKKIPVATLRASVGCRWARCRYCVQPRLHGRYRERDIDDVLLEAARLKALYGLTYFRLSDPSPSPSRISEIARGLSDDQRFGCFFYPEPDVDLGEAAQKLLAVFIGMERIDPAHLTAVNKCRNPDAHAGQTARIVEQSKALGITAIVANIVPTANDSTTSIARQLDYIRLMNPDFITITPLIPIPGSPLHKQILMHGSSTGIVLDDDYVEKMTRWTFDPLGPPEAWPEAPFRTVVDGELTAPLTVSRERFGLPLREMGIAAVSDDMVLMAYHHHKGLGAGQDEKRTQVLDFQLHIRETMRKGDSSVLRKTGRSAKPSADKFAGL